MNRTGLAMVIPLVLLAALSMTPIMVIEDAFARYQRHTGGDLSQAASVSNSCLNPVSNSNTNNNMISNGNCGGTVSQQGKSGQASNPTTVQSANPNIEVQRATTTPPTAQEPSPINGTVLLSVSIICDTGPGSCPSVDQLEFAVNTNGVSPTEFFPDTSGKQTLTFITPSIFEVALANVGQAPVLVSTDAPCFTSGSVLSIFGNIPHNGETISCNITVEFLNL